MFEKSYYILVKKLVTRHLTTSSKKLLVAPGITTRNKKLLVTSASLLEHLTTSNKKLLGTRALLSSPDWFSTPFPSCPSFAVA